MSVLYVTETGAQVRREGERLAVWKGKKKLHTSSAYDLHQMVLFGNIGITPAAMHTALMQGIDLVLLSTTGSYRGRLVGPQGRNIILRQMQYRRYEDEDFRLGAARGFVSGKIRNMRTLIMRLARRRNRDIAHTAQRLRALLKQIDRIDNADALRGIEGAATATYFGALGQFFPYRISLCQTHAAPAQRRGQCHVELWLYAAVFGHGIGCLARGPGPLYRLSAPRGLRTPLARAGHDGRISPGNCRCNGTGLVESRTNQKRGL